MKREDAIRLAGAAGMDPILRDCFLGFEGGIEIAQEFAALVEAEVRKEIEAAVMAETKACSTLVSSLYKPGRHMSDYDSGFNWGIEYAEQSILGRLQPAPTSAQKEADDGSKTAPAG